MDPMTHPVNRKAARAWMAVQLREAAADRRAITAAGRGWVKMAVQVTWHGQRLAACAQLRQYAYPLPG